MTKLVRLAILLLLCAIAQARCAPRSVTIQYKASGPVPITVRALCSSKSCSPLPISISSICTQRPCAKISRCNHCSATLNARDLQLPLPETLRVYFAGESSPFYQFTSDWLSSGSEWYKNNGWIPGCDSRVGCVSRSGSGTTLDVAITAQACYTTVFRDLNAASLDKCVEGATQIGPTPGQVYGIDCREFPL